MKLGLLIANLQIVAEELGADVEVEGAMLIHDLTETPPVIPVSLVEIPNTPSIHLILAACPDCGLPMKDHPQR